MTRIALVLEDKPSDQVRARALLQGAGWEVHIAPTTREGYTLIESWLDPANQLQNQHMLVMIDLVMDMHGMHLAAIIRDEQIKGQLRPAPLVVLTAGYSEENAHLARLAGCDALLRKPLTPETVEQLAELQPASAQPAITEDEAWLRRWLIEEGRRLLKHVVGERRPAVIWEPKEIETLLKQLSGRGRQPNPEQSLLLLQRLGGAEHARSYLATLAPLLHAPLGDLLRHLLSGSSIEESGRLLGYSRSQAYELFRRLGESLGQLLAVDQQQSDMEQAGTPQLPSSIVRVREH